MIAFKWLGLRDFLLLNTKSPGNQDNYFIDQDRNNT